MYPWCSGYHVRFTRVRSLVQTQAETSFLLSQHLWERSVIFDGFVIKKMIPVKFYLFFKAQNIYFGEIIPPQQR